MTSASSLNTLGLLKPIYLMVLLLGGVIASSMKTPALSSEGLKNNNNKIKIKKNK